MRDKGQASFRRKADPPKCQAGLRVLDVGMQEKILHTVTFVESCRNLKAIHFSRIKPVHSHCRGFFCINFAKKLHKNEGKRQNEKNYCFNFELDAHVILGCLRRR